MSVYDSVIKDICPKCGNTMYSEGVNNGVGYIHPPFHCECGYSEMCGFADKKTCKRCNQYDCCYGNEIE